MPIDTPIWLRLNANTEKQYVQKLGKFFTGIIFRANLFEASPGLCSSLTIALSSPENRRAYAIDPTTYVFALDPNNDWSIRQWRKVPRKDAESYLRTDLSLSKNASVNSEWIRDISKPGKRDANKVEIFGVRKAYRRVADGTLGRLKTCIGQRALTPQDLQNSQAIGELTAATVDYQLQAVRKKFDGDKYKPFVDLLRPPDLLFAPYFPMLNMDWFEAQTRVWREFETQVDDPSATLIVNCRAKFLTEKTTELEQVLTRSKAANIALWIDEFNEESADTTQLLSYVRIARAVVACGKTCLNMFGGGFSAYLYGLGVGSILSCGYGEAKAVAPLGGGLPAAKYYIPNLHSRRSVAEAYDLIRRVGQVQTTADFITKICGCAICKEAVKKRVVDFASFYGEVGEPRKVGDTVRRFPTGRALERCRFHYLLSRLKEYQQFKAADLQTSLRQLFLNITFWTPIPGAADHLSRWRDALSDAQPS